jgi:hypothetical protein
MEHAQRWFLRPNNFYAGHGFSARAKQVSCHEFKPLKQVFVVRTKNAEFWHFVHENEPPSVELGLLNPQRVSAKFGHDLDHWRWRFFSNG